MLDLEFYIICLVITLLLRMMSQLKNTLTKITLNLAKKLIHKY